MISRPCPPALPALRLPGQGIAVLLGIAATLTVIDGVATYAWLQMGHAEANPLVDRAITTLGAAPALALRVTVGLVLLAALHGLIHRARLAPYALVLATGVLVGVGFWHGVGVALAIT